MEVVTVWVAIDDSDVENGCLRVIPRTQYLRLLSKDEMVATPGDENALSAAMERARFNQRMAADLLSLSYDQLRHAIKKHGLMEESD